MDSAINEFTFEVEPYVAMTGVLAVETLVATIVEAEPDSFNTCPGKMRSDERLLIDFNCESDTLWRAAIVDKLSPLRTVYVLDELTGDAVVFAAVATFPDTFNL